MSKNPHVKKLYTTVTQEAYDQSIKDIARRIAKLIVLKIRKTRAEREKDTTESDK